MFLVRQLLLVWLQGLWIYVEEKSKGTLKEERLTHFDRLEEYLQGKKGQTAT